MSASRIRVLIVDDSAVVREGLSELLGYQNDMEVVGTANNGHDAVRLAQELRPDVILMDIHMPDMDGLQATWLLSNRTPHGAVIMVTAEQRVEFLQKAMTAGAQGYVLKPWGDGQELLQTVRELYERVQSRVSVVGPEPFMAEARTTPGTRVTVFGPKGGVGKTSLAVGLALALRQSTQESVVIFDADFAFGDVAVHLDLAPRNTILDLVPHVHELDPSLLTTVIARHASGVHLLSRPPRPEQAEAIADQHVKGVLSALTNMYGHVIVDTHPSYDESMLAILDMTDIYVLVLVPDLAALQAMRHFLDVAKTLGYPEERMCFVLNRANSLAGLRIDDVTKALETRRILQIPSAGAAVSQAINRGRPLVLDQPRSPYAQAVTAVANQVQALVSEVQVGLH